MKILIVDNQTIPKHVNVSGYSAIFYVDDKADNNDSLKRELDYKEVEMFAYKLCSHDMDEYFSRRNGISEPIKSAIKKNMLQIYGYYYKKAEIVKIVEIMSVDSSIDVCSKYFEKKDEFENVKSIYKNNSFVYKLKLLNLLFRLIISPLVHKRHKELKTENVAFISSMTQLKLFNYYFKSLENVTFWSIDNKKSKRVREFNNYLESNNIPHFTYQNDEFIKTFLRLAKFMYLIMDCNSYKTLLIAEFALKNGYAYQGFTSAMGKLDGLKRIVFSDEFNSNSELLTFIAKRKGIETFNFQHGGVYLADHDYGKFIVMGEWIKEYYTENTNSNSKQFMVLGNPYIANMCISDKVKNNDLGVLFLGQYLFGYMNEKRKMKLMEALEKLSRISRIKIYYKEHPGATDVLYKKIDLENISIINKLSDYSEYDVALSFYSTTMIEAICEGVPAISMNFDSIKGILLLEKSGVFQCESIEALNDILVSAINDRKILRDMYEKERAKISDYWNVNKADWNALQKAILD